MAKPFIGIVEWPYTDKDGDQIFEVFNDVANWVIRSGGIPVGIFPTQVADFINNKVSEIKLMSSEEKCDLITSLNRCDAIIKPGALRIYNHERFIHSYSVYKDIPYLEICAGMQIMSGYHSEIKNDRNSECGLNHHQPGYGHDVEVLPDTLLSKIVDNNHFKVYSKHNYHISKPGVNRISAIACDGVIEAIENPECNYNLGVQWHPELAPSTDINSQKIFESLVEEAKIYSRIKR